MKDDESIDYVALLRRLRDQMNDETAEMAPEQRARFVRESADRLARRIPLPEYAGRPGEARRSVR